MSIFESKPQIFWRKFKRTIGKVFTPIGSGFKQLRGEFRKLPQRARSIVVVGGSVLAVLLIFAVFWLPMLQSPAYDTETPSVEPVSEAILRLDLFTQGQIASEDVDDLIAEIESVKTRSYNDREIVQLHMLRFKVYFNAGLFYQAALAGEDVRAMDFSLEGRERFEIYHLMVAVFGHIDDIEQRRYFARLVLNEFDNGTIEDVGSRQFYYAIAEGLI